MARPRSDLQQRIRHAARAHFLRHGVDGASLRAIAAEAKTTIGMVYYYFPAKDDLFLAVVEEVYAGLLASLHAILDGGGDFQAKLGKLYARLWSMSEDEYATVRLILREAMVSAARVRRIAERFLRGHIPLLLGMVAEARESGVLREEQPPIVQLIGLVTLGIMPVLVYRMAFPVARGPLELPDGEALRTALQGVLLHGIAQQPAVHAASAPRIAPRARPRAGAAKKR